MRNLFFIALSLLIVCTSCGTAESNSDKSLRNYYLPFDLLEQSDLIMEYRYVGTEDAPFYWYYHMKSMNEEQVLFTGEQLDAYGEILVETEELLVGNGILLKSQQITERDTATDERVTTRFDILSDDLFLFKDLTVESKIKSEISFQSNVYKGQKTIIDKERQYLGDTSIIYEGVSFPAKRFLIHEHYDIEEIGHLEFDLRGEEVYAEGLGLVYVRKLSDDGQAIEYYLHKYEIVDDES